MINPEQGLPPTATPGILFQPHEKIPPGAMKGRVLREIFETMHRQGLDYAVLRNYEGLPEKPGRDVAPYESYSPQVEQNLRRTLRETDILVLPYRRLSSTMDTPVLFLEGMASLCAILTYQLGDIPTIYGHSPFLLCESDRMAMGVHRVLEARNLLPQERQRIFERNRELDFETSRVADRLISALS